MGALLTAAVLLIGRPLIPAAYTDKAEVAAVAATLLAVLPLFHLFDSMQCINSYLLRAYKIAVVPLLLQTVALAGVGLVGGWWFGFGPGKGGLDWLRSTLAPGSPQGAGTMWLMAMAGLALRPRCCITGIAASCARPPLRPAAPDTRLLPSKEQPRGCSFLAQPEGAGRTGPDTCQA